MKGFRKPISDESKPRNGSRRRKKSSWSMESLNPHQIDCRLEECCTVNKRMRGIRDVPSCEVGVSDQSDSSVSESSAGSRSGEDDKILIGKSDYEVENQEEEDDDGDDVRGLPCVSNGWISVIGRRRVMEDAVVVAELDVSYHFFAVYDGHGGSGVANACRDRLHQMVEERVRGSGGAVVDWDKVMRSCFMKMDKEVGGDDRDGGSGGRGAVSVNTVGSTAVVVVVGKGVIVVANCGDSRAVLCREGGATVPLSRDHKVDYLFLFN